MKYLVGIVLAFLPACTTVNVDINNSTVVVNKLNPVLNAFRYMHFTESTHRYELEEFIGVDPVRTEWCAAFVNAVLNESGIPGSDTVSEYPLTAKSFLRWGETVSKKDIQPGDLVIFPRGTEAWQGHVGFYLKTIKKDNTTYYAILGGNQTNSVSIEFYKASKAISIRRYSF